MLILVDFIIFGGWFKSDLNEWEVYYVSEGLIFFVCVWFVFVYYLLLGSMELIGGWKF